MAPKEAGKIPGPDHWSRSPTLALWSAVVGVAGQVGFILVLSPVPDVVKAVSLVLLGGFTPVALPASVVAVVVGRRARRAGAGRRARVAVGLGVLGIVLWGVGTVLGMRNLGNLGELRNL